MDFGIIAGDNDRTIYFRLRDSTTGLAKTGLAFNSAGAVCSYTLPGAARVAITLATQTVTGAHSDGGFVQVDATNCKGLYRLDLPDAAVASGAYTIISIEFDATIEESIMIPLHTKKVNVTQLGGSATPVTNLNTVFNTDFATAYNTTNDQWSVSASAVASVTGAVGSVTGAVGSVTGSVGSVTGNVGGNVVGSVGSVVGHTAQTGDTYALANGAAGFVATKADTAAVKAKTDQFVFTVANQVDANALTGGGGLDAAGVRAAVGLATANLDTQLGDIPTVAEFNARTLVATAYFDPATDAVANVTLVATTTTLTNLPTITTDWISAAGVSAAAVTKIQNGLATPTNITAGTITTVTNLTNAPTNGDLTATMKASVNTEVDAAIETYHLDHLLAAAYDPTAKPGSAAGLLNVIVENDGGVPRYTANSLELAPTGGSAPTVGQIADAVWDEVLSGHLIAGTAGHTLQETLNAVIEDGTLDSQILTRMATYTQPTGFLAATFPGTVASTTNITAGTITTVTNLTNLPTIPNNWLTAAGIAAGALDGKGNWNIGKTGYALTAGSGLGNQTANITGTLSGTVGGIAGTITTLDALDTAQDAQHASTLSKMLKYFQLLFRKDAAIATDNSTEVTAINADGGSGAGAFANTTDSTEAIRDRGDAAWNTATGFSTHSASDVLTAFGTGSALTALVTATGFATPTNVTDARDAVIVQVDANETKIDLIITDLDNATDGLGALKTAIDAIFTTAIAESYAANGVAGTPAQILYMIQQAINEFAIAGTTKTVKRLDGSTTAATGTLDDATNPTSITRAT